MALDSAVNFVADDYTDTMRRLKVKISGDGSSHRFSGHAKPTVLARLDANLLVVNAYAENNAFFKPGSTSISAKAVAKAVMDIWMNSTGHRKNIFSADMTHLGIGMSGSATEGWYFTQVFVKFA